MTIVTSCNPVSHVMEQPNDRVWQTIKTTLVLLIRLKTCNLAVHLEDRERTNSRCSEIQLFVQK